MGYFLIFFGELPLKSLVLAMVAYTCTQSTFRLRQEGLDLENSLGCMLRPYFKKNKQNKSPAHYHIGLFDLLLLNLRVLYIFWIQVSYQIHYLHVFSPSLWVAFFILLL
jgi:hypothetical protein